MRDFSKSIAMRDTKGFAEDLVRVEQNSFICYDTKTQKYETYIGYYGDGKITRNGHITAQAFFFGSIIDSALIVIDAPELQKIFLLHEMPMRGFTHVVQAVFPELSSSSANVFYVSGGFSDAKNYVVTKSARILNLTSALKDLDHLWSDYRSMKHYQLKLYPVFDPKNNLLMIYGRNNSEYSLSKVFDIKNAGAIVEIPPAVQPSASVEIPPVVQPSASSVQRSSKRFLSIFNCFPCCTKRKNEDETPLIAGGPAKTYT